MQDEEQGPWFYSMTVTNNGRYSHVAGTLTPSRGATRFDMYEWVLNRAVETEPKVAGGAVLHFELQRNKL